MELRELEAHDAFARELGLIEGSLPEAWFPCANRRTAQAFHALVRVLALAILLVALVGTLAVIREPSSSLVATSSSPSPSVRPSVSHGPSATAAPAAPPTPRGYVLPTNCSYVGGPEIRTSATIWRVLCPQSTLTVALDSSLRAQGWQACGSAGGSFFYRNPSEPDVLVLRNYVNRSDATGELERHAASGPCGP